MQLLELNLRNYKVHRKLDLTFQPGVVGIVGDNGSGKSSIISAISFLFTGETETNSKKDSITLGQTEGWVRGRFLLNGKEGTLERHLNTSKTILTYDGVAYNKSTEVTQLWNELLQIDATIFNNVIVAKQGEIQHLFSEETAVRERIFQKIFMVPQTEKIRDVISKNYINTCPPEKPEEDVSVLQNLQATVAAARNRMLELVETKSTELVDSTTIKCISDRISFLEKCEADLAKKPELSSKLATYQEQLEQITPLLASLHNVGTRSERLAELRKRQVELASQKPAYQRKLSITSEIKALEQNDSAQRFAGVQDKIALLDKVRQDSTQHIAGLNAELKDIVKQKNELLQLRGLVCCPTCKQHIPDPEPLINSRIQQETKLKIELANLNDIHSNTVREYNELCSEFTKLQGFGIRMGFLRDELNKLASVEYDQHELDRIVQELVSLEEEQTLYQTLLSQQQSVLSEQRVIQERMANLSTYDGEASIAQELEVLNSALKLNEDLKGEIAQASLESAKLEHELLLLDQRIKTSEQNNKYNKTRKAYIDRLSDVYKLFAVSNFPRKLIETYMATVQLSLAKYLEYFSLPFTVKVEDGFKIRLYPEEDSRHPLPTVSGGQEMMIGICLRLALHKLFAQAFPIWIIDEGTTHLSESKKQNYFDLIDLLRTQKIIKQIIIIDHDERLGSVVDQTIQL